MSVRRGAWLVLAVLVSVALSIGTTGCLGGQYSKSEEAHQLLIETRAKYSDAPWIRLVRDITWTGKPVSLDITEERIDVLTRIDLPRKGSISDADAICTAVASLKPKSDLDLWAPDVHVLDVNGKELTQCSLPTIESPEEAEEEADELYAEQVWNHLTVVATDQGWGAFLDDVYYEDDVLDVYTTIPVEPAARTPEENAVAEQICAAALSYPEIRFTSIEVYADEPYPLIKSCPVPGPPSSPRPMITDVAAFLRDNYSNASWYPLLEDVSGFPSVNITTTIAPEQVSANVGVATEICRAALEAPGVTRVLVWPSRGLETMTECT